MPSLGIGALDVLLEWQHLKQVNDVWHDTYYYIPASFLLQLKLRNVSL